MTASDLEVKQQTLTNQKRRLWLLLSFGLGVLGVTFIFDIWLIMIDFPYKFFLSSICSIIRLKAFHWYLKKLMPMENSVKELADEVQEETSAHWRDEIIARIKSGKIKPNPNLREY